MIVLGACRSSTLNNQKDNELTCPSLPEDFQETDLIGTWIAEYFENSDKLVINADGTYKQMYSSLSLSFESEWQNWRIEYHPQGYALLHLSGMRRCDDISSICNASGGGLPPGEAAINPCTSEPITYTDEVILFITGYSVDVPRGIVLRHAKLAGSDWTYGFKLDESLEP